MSLAQLVGDEVFASPSGRAEKLTLWQWLGRFLIGLALFLGSAGIGLEMAHWQEAAPLIWPPAGIGLVMVLRGGVRYLLVVAIGAFLIRYIESSSIESGLAFAAAYMIATFAAAWFLRRVARFDDAMERLTDVLAFISGAVVAAPLISALLTTWSLSAEYANTYYTLGELLAVRWLSDALGILVITPITLVWHARTRINWRNTQAVEVLVWLAILIFLGAMIFRNWAPTDTLRYPLELTMFPLMAWAAIRFGQRGATTGILIVSMMAVWELRDVIGPDATHTITQPPGYLWLFVGVLSGTSLFLAAVLTEQKNREDEIRVNEERLRALIQAMPDLAFLISAEGRFLEIFAPRNSYFGGRAGVLKGKMLGELYPPELVEEFMVVIQDVLEGGDVRVHRYPIDHEGRRHWFEARVAPIQAIEGQPRSVVWVAYDITESHTAIQGLRERDRLLQAVTEAESGLLRSTDYVAGRQEALALLGARLSADVVAVYGFRQEDPNFFRLLDQWRSPGMREAPSTPDFFDASGLGQERHARILQGMPLAVESLEELPAPFSARFEGRGADRALWLPVYTADRFWGILLFGRRAEGEAWNESDRVILTSFANSFGGFLTSQQIEEALLTAKQQADAASSAKSEFLAMMSHEIRTPMNAILGFADILGQSRLTEEQAEYLKIINRSGKDLLELINNILDFSKLESAPIDLEEMPFRIETTVMEVLEIMLMKAREKGIDLQHRIDDPTDGVYLGDPMRMRQILLNLVSNAVKFTDEGRVAVEVTSRPNDDGRYRVHLVVIDTGIGIPVEAQDRLFEAFTQVDSSTTREYGGTGLGLSICKRLAESMDGAVWVESEVGVGSRFHVEVLLPATSEFSEPPPIEAMDDFLDSSFAERHPLRILLAEDDAVNTRLAMEILHRLGYAPDHAADGAAAARLLTERQYDVAILDVQMAHLDGLALTRMLRAGDFGEAPRQMQVIALTAMARTIDEEQCRAAGASGFLAKPFALSDFKNALQAAYRAQGRGASPHS